MDDFAAEMAKFQAQVGTLAAAETKAASGSTAGGRAAPLAKPAVVSSKPMLYTKEQMHTAEKNRILSKTAKKDAISAAQAAEARIKAAMAALNGVGAMPPKPAVSDAPWNKPSQAQMQGGHLKMDVAASESRKRRAQEMVQQKTEKTKPKPIPKKKKHMRSAAGKVWEDKTLKDWPENDYRLFCGDLGNEVNDTLLAKAFQKYPSFAKARVVREKKTQKTKGFGFVSFIDPMDCAKALREVQGEYIGNRPVKLRRSEWKERDLTHRKRKKLNKYKKTNKLVIPKL